MPPPCIRTLANWPTESPALPGGFQPPLGALVVSDSLSADDFYTIKWKQLLYKYDASSHS